MADSFATRDVLDVNGRSYTFASLARLGQRFDLARLPYSMKILLENLLRHEDGGMTVGTHHIEAVATWDPKAEPDTEIAFMPARVVLQDFTGVPCVVDLAAMRDAVTRLGGSPSQINPLIPSELVIDHSVQVDVFGRADALDLNGKIEFERNKERYGFLRWGQNAFQDFKVVPPNTGIVHQVNLEHLARVVMEREVDGALWAFPDTVFGTDSHTTMINGIGVLGWGVGGIEAEAAMLGQPSSMLIPQVVGFKLTGRMPEGATATDLVLTVTQMLRKHGVVGKFVEFFGEGLQHLPLADRATIGNMAPEYGATCGIFPVDAEAVRYLRLSGRSEEQIALVEAYAKAQGLWHEAGQQEATYSAVVELDMGTVKPSLAGPRRPQDRVLLEDMKANFNTNVTGFVSHRAVGCAVQELATEGGAQPQAERLAAKPVSKIRIADGEHQLCDGSVVIAAITSCTNTSNPAVMLGAGLLARNAVAKGLTAAPWVKTSLGPGSLVVTDYLKKAGVMADLEKLGFFVVGYGCTTCIGNSGPLPEAVSKGIAEKDLAVAAVLSGNRNFEGRIHAEVKMNYLASPPLVVAYAIAGTVDIDLTSEPLGQDRDGNDVYLRDIWPSNREIGDTIAATVGPELFAQNYADVFKGDARWNAMESPDSELYAWDEASTYIKNPPYFDGMTMDVGSIDDIQGARVLGLFGDSITTDHISPAGNIKKDSPAGAFLQSRGVQPADFNSYGSRRGNDDVMVRGTFANIRIRNRFFGGEEGGNTLYFGSTPPAKMSIYDAAMKYKADGTPLVVLAGAEYGTGSSRDWAAKGTNLLGVKAVIAQSFERIHRSNLVGMGVLPLQFRDGENADSLGLDGTEVFDITGLEDGRSRYATVTARKADGTTKAFQAHVLLLTPKEVEYFRHGGLLHYVLRQLAAHPAN
ncbi:aconitate hydratase AcnA [Luteimonas sp. MC1572]|uniref:aconitate hydratase AcnA n=1 Tax=Luteimonas sp. MC1572 TaxID=2799325 RepID=UPI0018F088CB|nr:aconitate hydratase AcnA [Luteimonas sp. MC1572]MBJ6980611.1 aconitate hydratase AcnA [Luteimonas sp. MC1572]QQO01990.1 aconitate hydratase AcnA [Luteimonas sp. MC1572]